MPTPAQQLDQLLATTFPKVRKKLVDQVTTRHPVLAALQSKNAITEDGGTELRIPIMHALNDTIKSYSGYDLFDTTPQGGLGYAVFEWRNIVGTVTISGEEIRKNSGSAAFINLLQTKFDQLRLGFEKKFDQFIWAATPGAKDPLSLPVLIGNTGTLGGIDSATETFWQSKVVPGPANLTSTAGVRTLNNLYNSLWVDTSAPDFEFTTQANFEAYEQLAATNIRFTQTKMADMGFESIAHKTAEVVFDPSVPAPAGSGGGYWYMVNTDHLQFVWHKDAKMKKLDTQRPYNQDAYTTPVISMGNFVTDSRRAHGVITSTTV